MSQPPSCHIKAEKTHAFNHACRFIACCVKMIAFVNVRGLLLHVLIWPGNNLVAGHLLDPNLDVRAIIGRGLHSLILCWSFRGETTEGLTASILAPMLQRLALDHEELLAAEHVVFEANENVLKLAHAARVWKLIAGKMESFLDVPWSSCLIVCSGLTADQ